MIKYNKIYNKDFLDFSKKIPEETIDLIVTSPPYGIGKEYEKKIPLEDYLSWSTKVFTEFRRILKDTGSLFYQVGTYVGEKGVHYPWDIMLFPLFVNLEFISRNRIIWIRQHGTHAKHKFSNRHESILWFTKSHNYKFNLDGIRVPQKYPNKKGYRKGKLYGKFTSDPRGKNPGDVWAFRNVKHNHEEQTVHPCQFPEDMITRIILATTDPKDIVFDPFIGSGTTAVVAKHYNRRFLGCEIVEEYVNIANHRLKGEPDKNNNFPNLKTLRHYVDLTGEDIAKFTYSRQVGKVPTPSKNSRIFSENYHLEKTIERITYEAENPRFKGECK
ncbi:MAG: site-specific DNA-methyltransferase [Candidatus Heimdallarchaeota archaeon]|nr:MAG: site-specific DNA-methyltransferase [Candidatus Heimdallarchaeota archaeon]